MWHPWKREATRFTHRRPGEIRGSINKGDSLVFPGSPENLTIEGLHAWSNTNARNIEPAKVDSCECKGAPLPPQSLRHGTWGIWWARALAWSTTIGPGQVVIGILPQEGTELDALPRGLVQPKSTTTKERAQIDMPLQGGPNKGKNEVEHRHCDWAGTRCTPETPWQDNRTEGGWPHQNQPVRRWHHRQQSNHAPWPKYLSSDLAIEGPFFVLRPIHRVQHHRSERYRSAAQDNTQTDMRYPAVVKLVPPITTHGPAPYTIKWSNGWTSPGQGTT